MLHLLRNRSSSFATPGSECRKRGAREEDVRAALRLGQREPAQRGLVQYRLNIEFKRDWAGRYYGVQQIVPVVDEEAERIVVVTIYTFYFQEGELP